MQTNSDFSKLPSGLYIVATPIGNLKDITFRAVETLKNVDIIYCEDTRQSKKLLSHYSINTHLASYHEYNAEKVRPQLIEKLEQGLSVALISDAGTPLISDPGYKLVAECQSLKIKVYTLPGPSAPIAALSCSGLPSDKFFFSGFMPAKSGERAQVLEDLKDYQHTMIFFETPNRLLASFADIERIMGDRAICVARELTKTFEDIRKGSVRELIHFYQNEGVLKGEVVLLIQGATADRETLGVSVETALKALITQMPVKQASSLLAEISGVSKKVLYQRALELRNEDETE